MVKSDHESSESSLVKLYIRIKVTKSLGLAEVIHHNYRLPKNDNAVFQTNNKAKNSHLAFGLPQVSSVFFSRSVVYIRLVALSTSTPITDQRIRFGIVRVGTM